MLWIGTAKPQPSKQKRIIRTGVLLSGVMEHLADLDPPVNHRSARRLDVRDDHIHALCRPWGRRRNILAEDDRTTGARRSELNDSVVAATLEVGIEPPAQTAVELLRAIHIRDRDHYDFELRIHLRDLSRSATSNFIGAHRLSPVWD